MKRNGETILALARKEIFSSLQSVSTYGVILFFLLFNNISFFYIQKYFSLNTASLRNYFTQFPLVFSMVIPALTMKSWAEERKVGTAELLLTMPFSEWDLVLAKFLSSFVLLLVLLLGTLGIPLTIMPMGKFDVGVIITEYIGALLLGSAAISIGLLWSALSKNQIGAYLGTLAILFSITLINQVATVFPLPETMANALNYLSLAFHYEGFSKGILDSRDILFFGILTFLMLFINTRVILYRKWR
ncbi:MAG TPA: ABC transporter permease subunit [Termitinemataceae bacterium]|jgi:ABC-2 type transport system permease protein|uniref:ABC transporter permease n=1 Tax=Treponema sp. J25 TaxID=2094121 RepID=UPI0010519156|nr:ABC transporter permease subunit [Treponema sp. J25]TCW60841.1 ABC transporter permease [Treponema sp. J25]HOJ99700.1 ABC transporter permease subunit [Termitinemataceae bacterium]HOM23871.1 ABC transporter permease subunit [Termitinemataceae bacterium]HPQ00934.1 ABC transporter permease subunit [Termitinemataceae bacterium]